MATLTALMQTSGACPEQYEGETADGREVYIRHRHGHGHVSIGPTLDDAITAGWPGFGGRGRELLAWVDEDFDGMLRPGALAHILYCFSTEARDA